MAPSNKAFAVGEIFSDSRRKISGSIKQITYSAKGMSVYVRKLY